ncbi:MAG: glutamate racemase [bacterium]|nr:glutamate racemase [bacterium]MBU1918253.1 glutamate racemase [bacterium]
MNNKPQPIGIFDSGIGGLTVYRELKKQLPHESFVYLGDTARVPYGTKSSEIVLKYAMNNSLFLMNHNVKLIVVACNTASAIALDFLKARLKTPVIGVIEPGAQAAITATKNNIIGVIGTEGTIKSKVYPNALKKLNPAVVCHSLATGLFVPLIEEGIYEKEILDSVLNYYLNFFEDKDIDTLILGCTHYPILAQQFNAYLNNRITLVDSAKTTAQQVVAFLTEQNALNDPSVRPDSDIYFTDAPKRVQRIARTILDTEMFDIKRAHCD